MRPSSGMGARSPGNASSAHELLLARARARGDSIPPPASQEIPGVSRLVYLSPPSLNSNWGIRSIGCDNSTMRRKIAHTLMLMLFIPMISESFARGRFPRPSRGKGRPLAMRAAASPGMLAWAWFELRLRGAEDRARRGIGPFRCAGW